MTRVLSYGGGVQSTALACLILSGRLERPDLIVIADTGREASTTWGYLWEHIQPELAVIGVQVYKAPHALATVDLYGAKGRLLIPAYTTKHGRVGQLPNFCSVEWKRRVIHRWLRRRGIRRAELWLGISPDEAHRMKDSPVKWITHRYPLVDLGVTRSQCRTIIAEAGFPQPPKSSCWMCPYRGPAEWAALPGDDFNRALLLDKAIRARDPFLSLSKTGAPLSEADRGADQASLPGCDGGFCWT